MTLGEWLAYLAACLAVAAVPGPSLSLIIATSLRHGARAGLANVAGTQAGFALMVLILAFGFQALLEHAAPLFFWLRLAGAAYLVWLGARMILSAGARDEGGKDIPPTARAGFARGFLVLVSNPKVLLFLGAFLPQFVHAGPGGAAGRIILLGAVFMAIAATTDTLYVLAAGRAGSIVSSRKAALGRILGGAVLMGGGAWLALSRR